MDGSLLGCMYDVKAGDYSWVWWVYHSTWEGVVISDCENQKILTYHERVSWKYFPLLIMERKLSAPRLAGAFYTLRNTCHVLVSTRTWMGINRLGRLSSILYLYCRFRHLRHLRPLHPRHYPHYLSKRSQAWSSSYVHR